MVVIWRPLVMLFAGLIVGCGDATTVASSPALVCAPVAVWQDSNTLVKIPSGSLCCSAANSRLATAYDYTPLRCCSMTQVVTATPTGLQLCAPAGATTYPAVDGIYHNILYVVD